MYCVLFPVFLGFITNTAPKMKLSQLILVKFVILLLGKSKLELNRIPKTATTVI